MNKNFSNLQRPRRLVMGTQLCMHFGQCIHPWRSVACTPFIIPFSPFVCHSVCSALRKGHPVCSHKHLPPSHVASTSRIQMLMWFMYIYAFSLDGQDEQYCKSSKWTTGRVVGQSRICRSKEEETQVIYCCPFLVARLSLPSHFLQYSNICMKS